MGVDKKGMPINGPSISNREPCETNMFKQRGTVTSTFTLLRPCSRVRPCESYTIPGVENLLLLLLLVLLLVTILEQKPGTIGDIPWG